jgi:hypothetical protein
MRRRRTPHYGEALVNILGMGGLLVFYQFQAIDLFLHRNATGLSLPAFVALLIGCCGLVGASLRIRSKVLVAVNLVAAVYTAATIVGIILWR